VTGKRLILSERDEFILAAAMCYLIPKVADANEDMGAVETEDGEEIRVAGRRGPAVDEAEVERLYLSITERWKR
jgi:hypothetical protein